MAPEGNGTSSIANIKNIDIDKIIPDIDKILENDKLLNVSKKLLNAIHKSKEMLIIIVAGINCMEMIYRQ